MTGASGDLLREDSAVVTLPSTSRRTVAGAVALGVAYYLGARIGFAFQSPVSPQSVLWLPNSILLAVLLVVPPRVWWLYLAAAFPAQLVSGWQGGAPLATISLHFVTNCLDAMLGASLLRRGSSVPWRFDGLSSTLRFLALAATLAPVVVSFADAAITVWTGWGADYESALFTRIRANVLTNMILVPAIVAMLGIDPRRLRGVPSWRMIESAVMTLALVATASLVFSATSEAGPSPGLLVVPLPFLFWAAARLGPGVTSAGLFAVAVVLSWNASRGAGPFSWRSPDEAIAAVQLFLVGISAPLLCLAGAVSDHRRTAAILRVREDEARRQLAEMRAIYRTAPIGLSFVDRELRIVSINDRLALLHGVPAAAHVGHRIGEIMPHLASMMEPVLRSVMTSGVPVVDQEVVGVDGSRPGAGETWLVSYHPVMDDRSAVFGVNIAVRDVTQRKRDEASLREAQQALRASYERIRELAQRLIATQEAERKRIARELHDDVNQRLAAMSISLSTLTRRAANVSSDLRDGLSRLKDLTISLSTDIREMSHELHSSVLQHAGLVPALRDVCADVGRHHPVEVRFRGGEIGSVPDEVALCLYRVGQEALRNVTQHASAKHVSVELDRAFDRISLIVADDGRGIDAADARRRGGLGLISIEERVRMTHGTVVVEAAPDRGTRLRVSVPLQDGYATTARTARR
jgi:PAS domain S-box-containing protein